MFTIQIIVPEQAVPQPRPRARRLGKRVQVYVPKGKSASYRKSIIASVREQLPGLVIDSPCVVTVEFAMRMASKNRVALYGEPHDRRPDIDNMLKTTFDGLVDSGLFPDDNIIWKTIASKRWCRRDEVPTTYITVEYENTEGGEAPPDDSQGTEEPQPS